MAAMASGAAAVVPTARQCTVAGLWSAQGFPGLMRGLAGLRREARMVVWAAVTVPQLPLLASGVARNGCRCRRAGVQLGPRMVQI